MARYCGADEAQVVVTEVLYVALGGAVGSSLRFIIDRSYGDNSFPIATLTVNLVGAFLLGFMVGSLGQKLAPAVQLALFTGLLGGFTTFSTFALESVELMRSGNAASALGYVVISIGIGVLLAFVGLLAGEAVT